MTPSRVRRSNPEGFTLIELLLVLLIMGLIATALSLSVSSSHSLLREAQQLALRLEETAHQARSSGSNHEWQPTAGGYRILRQTAPNLSSPETPPSSLEFPLPEGFSVRQSLTKDGAPPLPVILPARGIAGTIRLTLSSPEQEIDVFSPGFGRFETTPPVARLERANRQ